MIVEVDATRYSLSQRVNVHEEQEAEEEEKRKSIDRWHKKERERR